MHEKGIEAHHIESFDQLNKDWFIKKQHVGITAGTSTPENVINEVHAKILEIAKEIKKALITRERELSLNF